MTLLDEARSLAKSQGPKCRTGELLKTAIGPELAEAIAESGLQITAIVRALAARDIHLAVESLRRHRNGECACRDAR